MLLTPITSLNDQTVAEAMREIAQKRHCDTILTEQSVDEAVRLFQSGASRGEAINSGLALIIQRLATEEIDTNLRRMRRSSDHVTNFLRNMPEANPQPAAWIQGDGFACVCLAAVVLWFAAVAFGWTP